jgi:hypothetical protein
MLHKCNNCGEKTQCQATPPSESSVFYMKVWGKATFMFMSLLAFFLIMNVISKQYGLVRLDRMIASPDVSYNEFRSSAGDQPDTEKFDKVPRNGPSLDAQIQLLKENASNDRKLMMATSDLLQQVIKELRKEKDATEPPRKGVVGP